MDCVKNYMMRTLSSVHYEDTIAFVIEFMHKLEMTVFPVVDNENNFVGTFRTSTILKNIIPEQYGMIDTQMYLHDFDLAVENMNDLMQKKVESFMTYNVDTVKESDKMDLIANIMLKNEEQYVFVVNDNNKLRGYISRADLLYYLLLTAQKETE